MKRRRVPLTRSRSRRRGEASAVPVTGLAVGRLPEDDARDALLLQRLAWQATPAGFSGLMWVASVGVLLGIRALAWSLVAWIVRGVRRAGGWTPGG